MYSIAAKKIVKKDKSIVVDLELQVKDIRQQFVDQVKCLEIRTDAQTSLLVELQDFYKKRADIELDYAKSLEKFSKQLAAKQKTDKQKKDGWSIFSLYTHYQHVIDEVKLEAKNRASLADLYLNHVSCKLATQSEQLQRISRRCREISVVAQQEILRVLTELHTAMKTYQLCQAASWIAESKFQAVEAQKLKFEENFPKKLGSRKHRFTIKEFEKRQNKYNEFQLKALKFKNEYLLCIDAANAALHKYFADDLSDLLDCTDVGCEEWLRRLLETIGDCRQAVLDTNQRSVKQTRDFARDLDHRADKRRFLDAHHSAFTLPRKFRFKQHQTERHYAPATPNDPINDENIEVIAPKLTSHKALKDEYSQRYFQLNDRLLKLKTETEEIWKTLETAEKTLMDIQKLPEIRLQDYFTTSQGATSNSYSNSSHMTMPAVSTSSSSSTPINTGGGSAVIVQQNSGELTRRNSCRESESSLHKRKQDLCEIEDFYLQKFQQYLLASNLIRRLEARHDAIRTALGAIPVSADAVSIGGTAHPINYHHHLSQPHWSNGQDVSVISDQPPISLGHHVHHFNGTTPKSNCGVESSPSPNPTSEASTVSNLAAGVVRTRRKKRIGVSAQSHARQRPRLFGGTIEEYVDSIGQQIPLIIRSCVRMLSLYGLHHQGVFRVSGSQIEINCFRDAFERGEDPLANVSDASDVNSVAGVLKLYFRELREPLFPIFMFDQFVECSCVENKEEFARKVQELVLSLPKPVFVVMRYLFAFLNHLSEFSDENMMDPYNLAICFGPTLLPIPESRDQVFYHNHVNELMKNMIVLHRDIFLKSAYPGTPLYEKYLVPTVGGAETGVVTSRSARNSIRLANPAEPGDVIEVTGDTKSDTVAPDQDDEDEEDDLVVEQTEEDDEEEEEDDDHDDALLNSYATEAPPVVEDHRLSSRLSTKSSIILIDDHNDSRPRTVSGGSRGAVGVLVDPLLHLSMHGSLRAMDDDAEESPPGNAATGVDVWQPRQALLASNAKTNDDSARQWRSLVVEPRKPNSTNDPYSLYANMHTSIHHGASSYNRRSCEASPSSLASADRSSSGSSSHPQNNNHTSAAIKITDSIALNPASLTRSYCGGSSGETTEPKSRAPLSETLALKQYDSRRQALTDEFERTRNIQRGVKIQALVPPLIHQPVYSANSAVKRSLVVDSSGYGSLTAPTADQSAERLQHHAPKGLSPTSLKEIQVELKAVLNSLESFTSQHQQTKRLSTNSSSVSGRCSSATGSEAGGATVDVVAVERRFGLATSLHPLSSIAAPVSPPDLVQNLPAASNNATQSSLVATNAEVGLNGNDLQRAKPPVPRKPSMSSPAASPQPNRRVTIEENDPSSNQKNSGSSSVKF